MDYSQYVVRQHDLLRELATYNSKRESMELRERLIIEICGNNFPKWLREQKYPYMNARLVAISTDGELSMKLPDMQLPKTEVLVLNFQSKTSYALPEFVERMDKLKVLLVINYSSLCDKLDNFQLLGSLSNLRSARFDGINISCITKSLVQLKNLQKLYLRACRDSGDYPVKLSHVFPYLKELVIESCEFQEFPAAICELIHLTKLKIFECGWITYLPKAIGNLISLQVLMLEGCESISHIPDSIGNLKKLEFLKISDNQKFNKLPEDMGKLKSLRHLIINRCYALHTMPESIGNLVNLELLILRYCIKLSELPESIRNLQKLNFLDIHCCPILELPKQIGELKSLRKLDMSSCYNFNELPESVSNLEQLEEAICEQDATNLWTPLLATLKNLSIVVSSVEDFDTEPWSESDREEDCLRESDGEEMKACLRNYLKLN